MKDKSKSPLKVALHGMDGRTNKMMVMYLQGPCKGAAAVVEDLNAEIDIIDADSLEAKTLLERKLAESAKPIIALSLQELTFENILYVKKPVKVDDMLFALSEAAAILSVKKRSSNHVNSNMENTAIRQSQSLIPKTENVLPSVKDQVKKLTTDEQKKTSKHQTAMQLDEGKFNSYIGSIPGLDVNDPKQFTAATYNPKQYFQGYVQSALMVAEAKKQVMCLNSSWKPLIIFPHNYEIWLDADDKQLRAFASVVMNKISVPAITLTPVESATSSIQKDLEKFHSKDAFLWKLAAWTSKGRYPDALDIHRPVFLKHWPNFTRLVITPHALRIAALLIASPRTLPEIADILKIKPQYVFVFISAAYALGLIGQAKRKADEIIQPSAIKKSEQQGLLNRIIGKLSLNKS
ncbi:hypothetical protein [Methylobacter sp.]|uniref:hypothetical protein n=1 Tax=Methylobacter sp. TaxID=2051955 RepID=UPI0012119763|nr:hypothetical protein [Methylobacter sp.]TAK63798.1 MAG: hypothetical protein EPO18_05740 [Methylobacter sp.]